MAQRSLVFDLVFKDKGSGLVFDRATRGLSKLQQTGKRMESTGRSLTRGLTLPIIGAGIASAKLASDFQASMSKITGLVGISQDQVGAWSDQVLDLAKTLPQGPKELADALFFVTSAGLRGKDAMDALTVSAKGAAAGLGETKVVADAITSAVNAYGSANLSAARAGDVLVATVREGKAEASALAPVFGRILPLASEMGVRFEDVGASLAAMTRIGMDADEAATSLQAIMSGLIKPSSQGAKALESVGLSYAKIRGEIREKGLFTALMDVRGAFHGNQEEIAKVIPNVRALRGFMALTGSQANETRGIFDRMSDSTGSLEKAFQEAAQTSEFKFKTALSSLQVAGIKIGAQLLPVFVKIAQAGSRMADAIGELPAPARTALIALGGLAATLGPLLIIAGKLVQSYAAVRKAIVGTNAVLAANRAAAMSAAASEQALAVSTARAAVATRGAAASFALWGGALTVAAAAVAGFIVDLRGINRGIDETYAKAGRKPGILDRLLPDAGGGRLKTLWRDIVSQLVHGAGQTTEAMRKHADVTRQDSLENVYAARQQEKLRQEMVRTLPQFQTAADKARINAEAIQDLSGKLDKVRGEYAALKQPIQDAILGFDGLISKSKVTAKQVIASLHDQVANFRIYARDTQRLLKAGVDPAAIEELSKRGPQYVHALATGSNAQLRIYKQYWHDRQVEIKGSFEASMQKQYEGLVRKIKAMQRQINTLQGKTINIRARTSVEISKSVKAYLAAANVPGFHARGTLVPGYGGGDVYPAMLEPGEAVVPKDKARQPEFRGWAHAMGIPGFQLGGLVGRYYNPTVAQTRRVGQSMADVAAAVLGRLAPGGPADVRSVAAWTIAALRRPLAELGAWIRRIIFESGGRWSAVNRTDSNWLAGHPSVGGAQVIRGTFQRWAGPYRSVGPYLYGVSINPRANSYAGANYAVHTYGSLLAVDPRVRPYGYDSGRGVLPPGLSLSWNGTGRTEELGPVGGGRTIRLDIKIPIILDGRQVGEASRQHIIGLDTRMGGPGRSLGIQVR